MNMKRFSVAAAITLLSCLCAATTRAAEAKGSMLSILNTTSYRLTTKVVWSCRYNHKTVEDTWEGIPPGELKLKFWDTPCQPVYVKEIKVRYSNEVGCDYDVVTDRGKETHGPRLFIVLDDEHPLGRETGPFTSCTIYAQYPEYSFFRSG